MDYLEIQIWSDINDLKKDKKSGLFEEREWELQARWSALARKIDRWLENKEDFITASPKRCQ